MSLPGPRRLAILQVRLLVSTAMLGACLASTPAVRASTFTVTNTSGSAATPGSLPWAVDQANTAAGLDFIAFNISGSGVQTITISSSLTLTGQVVIDGKRQPGYTGSPRIYVRGPGIGGVPNVFTLTGSSSGSTIQGLGLYGFSANGLAIFGSSTGNWIQDNWIGFFNDGAGAILFNKDSFATARGIALQSSFNVIRGNTIMGVDRGVFIGDDIASPSGAQYKTNSIQSNRIGTDPTGRAAYGLTYGNSSAGIFLGAGARENFLGPDNVLSANASGGIELLHATNVGNVAFRNRIGTSADGTAALGNGERGVLLASGANGNAVGGAFGGNLISANGFAGVSLGAIGFGGANGNWVQNNVVGLDVGQSASLGGQDAGVAITMGSTLNAVEGNVLAGQVEHGAVLSNVVTNSVSHNWIGTSSDGTPRANAGFGILFQGASYNFAVGNVFGTNGAGNIGQENSCCNDIRSGRAVLNEFGVTNFGESISSLPVGSQLDMAVSLGYRGFGMWHPSSPFAPPEPPALPAYLGHPAVVDGRLHIRTVLYAVDAANLDRDGVRTAIDETARAGALPLIVIGSFQPFDRDIAVAVVRDMADMAAQANGGQGVTLVLYPHAGSWMSSAEAAQDLLQGAGRGNVKLILNLCHELKAGNQNRLADVISRTAGNTVAATINGADIQREAEIDDYTHTIKPLDEGDFDVERLFLRPLLDAGYNGPILLHTHGFSSPADDPLRRSIARWRQMVAAYEAP